MVEKPVLLLTATKNPQIASVAIKKKSELLNDIIKDNFATFLAFIYADADKVLDLSKEVHFIDKDTISDNKDEQDTDLVAKLDLKDGPERWITLNLGIEEITDSDLAYYTFQYDCRIHDQFGDTQVTIAFLTGKENEPSIAISYCDEAGTLSITPILFYKMEKESPWHITIQSL